MKRKIGFQLLEALKYDELAKLFDAAFSVIIPDHLDMLLSHLDGKTADRVVELLSSSRYKINKNTSPHDKIIQQWNRLWELWDTTVAKLGDEEGDYTAPHHTWEAPRFNCSQFAGDLDEISRYLLPLIEKIVHLNIADIHIFENALQDIEKYFQEYPDWTNLDAEFCQLEMFTSRCVTEWTWMTSSSTEDFIIRLNRIEESLNIIQFNPQGIIHFFESLKDIHQKQIFDYIKQHEEEAEWEIRLSPSNSFWNQVYLNLSCQFDTLVYHRNCLKLINENWLYGIPSLKNLLKNAQWEDADKLCHLIISHYVVQEGETVSWELESTLLAAAVKRGLHHIPDEAILGVLQDWRISAEKMETDQKVRAIQFQQITYQNPYDWDKIADMIRQIGSSSLLRLIEAWQLHIVSIAIGFKPGKMDVKPDCWINWLIESGLDTSKGTQWFSEKMLHWLEDILNNSKAFMEQKQPFFVLTRDLAELTDIKTRFPQVVQICTASIIGDKAHNHNRREWLNRMKGENFLPLVLKCWAKCAPAMVPDPTVVISSNYSRHVRWLAVVKEVNPEAFKQIVDQWKFEHGRRRKLWTTMNRYIDQTSPNSDI